MMTDDEKLEELYKTKTIANYIAVAFVLGVAFICGLILF